MNEKYIGDGFNYPNWMFFKVKSFNNFANQMIVESIDQKTDEAIDLILPKKTDDDGKEINEVVTEDTIIIFNPDWFTEWPQNTSVPVEDQVLEPKLYVFRTVPESGNTNTAWETEKFAVPGSKNWSIGLRGDYCQIVYTGVYDELEYKKTDILDDNTNKGDLDFLNDDYLDDPDKIPKFAGSTPGGVDDSNEFCNVDGTSDADLIKSQADSQEKTIRAAMSAMGIRACKSDYACVTAEASSILGSVDATACAQSTVGCEQVVANFANTVNAQKQISCFIKETIQSNVFNVIATNEANITIGKDSECCAACGKGTAVSLDGAGNPIYTSTKTLKDGSVIKSGVTIVKVQCTDEICNSKISQTNNIKVAVNTQFSTQDVTNIQKKLAVAIAHDIENLQTSVRDGERNVTPMPPGSKAMNVSSQINSTIQMDKTLNRNIQEALYNVTSSNITNLDIGEGVIFQGPCFNINQENMIEFQVSAMMDAAFNSISGTDALTDLGTKIKNTQEQRSTSTDEEGGFGMLFLLLVLFAPLIGVYFIKSGYIRAVILVFNSIGWFFAGFLLGSLEESFLVSTANFLDDTLGDIIEILSYVCYGIGAVHIIAAIVYIYLEATRTRDPISEDTIGKMGGEDQGRALDRNRRIKELNDRNKARRESLPGPSRKEVSRSYREKRDRAGEYYREKRDRTGR